MAYMSRIPLAGRSSGPLATPFSRAVVWQCSTVTLHRMDV